MTQKLVHVVAAVILNEQGEFLLSSRPEGKPYAGYWEFAGGKVEAGEAELEALQRELYEELGIRIHAATPWLTKIHHYEHASVLLRFFRVLPREWQGEVVCREAQQYSWQQAGRFDVEPMLPANGPILRALSLPLVLRGNTHTGWTGVNGVGEVSMGFTNQDIRLLPINTNQTDYAGLQLQSLQAASDVQTCAADAWWWQPRSVAEINALLAQLNQGCAVPIVALLPEANSHEAERLQAAGVHIAYNTDEKALLA